MPRYYLSHQGYTIHPQDPGFPNLKSARKALQDAEKSDLHDARRKWKRAVIIAKTPNHRAIHAMRDENSPLRSPIAIVSF